MNVVKAEMLEDIQAFDVAKLRLSMSVSRIKHEFSAVDETNARQQVLIDRLSERLQRIEARLELISIGGQNG